MDEPSIEREPRESYRVSGISPKLTGGIPIFCKLLPCPWGAGPMVDGVPPGTEQCPPLGHDSPGGLGASLNEGAAARRKPSRKCALVDATAARTCDPAFESVPMLRPGRVRDGPSGDPGTLERFARCRSAKSFPRFLRGKAEAAGTLGKSSGSFCS